MNLQYNHKAQVIKTNRHSNNIVIYFQIPTDKTRDVVSLKVELNHLNKENIEPTINIFMTTSFSVVNDELVSSNESIFQAAKKEALKAAAEFQRLFDAGVHNPDKLLSQVHHTCLSSSVNN